MKVRLAVDNEGYDSEDARPMPAVAPALMARLRARIARRPGRWRKRMHTKKERREEATPPIPAPTLPPLPKAA